MNNKQIEFLKNYNFKWNIIFVWDVWVWKTYESEQILNRFDNILKYKITDTRFKEYIWGGNLRLKKPEEWQSTIFMFPLEMMIRSKLLLFDDIWVSDCTEAYLRKLTFVLDERIAKKLPTIFTTNLSPAELEKKLDKRIKSRIFLDSTIIQMEWEDRRKTNIKII